MPSRAVSPFDFCPAVSARGLTKSFARGLARAPRCRTAVASLDIDLHAGELLAIVGKGGAGKTTLLQCLAGLLRPDDGRVELHGEPIQGGWCPPGVAYVPAVPVFYPFLTPRDIIESRVARESLGSRREDDAQRFLAALELVDVARTKVVALPRDVIRRVSIAEALAGRPGVILVDTSPADLVTPLRGCVLSSLAAASEEGAAVAVTTRDASAIAFAATRMLLMEDGRASRTFALESLGEPIVTGGPAIRPRFVAERVH